MPIHDVVSWILDEDLPQLHKMLLLMIVRHTDTTVTQPTWLKLLKVNKNVFDTCLQSLCSQELINKVNSQLVLSYNGELFRVTTPDVTVRTHTPVRKAKTLAERARHKLEMLRISGFVGVDLQIYKLATDYDKLVLKYTNKRKVSLPPNPPHAKKSSNWTYFKRLHELLVLNKYNTQLFLETQFQALSNDKLSKNFGTVFPYPSMLSSAWAVRNYVDQVKQHVETETVATLLSNEYDLVREVLQSSHTIVNQMTEANTELSELQCLLMLQDNLSPLYLALNKTFLAFFNKHDLDLPEDLSKTLARLSSDKDYKAAVIKIHKELFSE